MNEIILANQLKEHMNLSYTIINDPIKGVNLNRSLFNGTVINSKNVVNTQIQLSEWSGAKINDCSIEKCNFCNSEIKSTWFKKVTFINVIFDDAFISDSIFSNCIFIGCKVIGTIFQENNFFNCCFQHIDFSSSSINMSVFKECEFIKSEIGGSFYYSFFEGSKIIECSIDQYLLGYILGILDSYMDGVKYIKRDHEFEGTFDDLINDLNQQYKDRMKFINSAILMLNLKQNSNIDYLILSCVNAFIISSKNKITISSDDIKFIKYVIEDYFNKQIISPCMLFEASNIIEQELYRMNSDDEQNKKQLNSLYNCIFFCQQRFIANIKPRISLKPDALYTLFIKYEHEPEISAADILNDLSPSSMFKAKRVKTETGSFHEWIQSDGNAIIAFGFFMDFLGITIPIIYDIIKEKRKKKKEKRNKEQTKNNNLLVSINTYINTISSISTTQGLTNVINTVNTSQIKVENDFQGYNAINVIEIKIINNID